MDMYGRAAGGARGALTNSGIEACASTKSAAVFMKQRHLYLSHRFWVNPM